MLWARLVFLAKDLLMRNLEGHTGAVGKNID